MTTDCRFWRLALAVDFGYKTFSIGVQLGILIIYKNCKTSLDLDTVLQTDWENAFLITEYKLFTLRQIAELLQITECHLGDRMSNTNLDHCSTLISGDADD